MIEPSVARRTITSPDYNYNKFTGAPLVLPSQIPYPLLKFNAIKPNDFIIQFNCSFNKISTRLSRNSIGEQYS